MRPDHAQAGREAAETSGLEPIRLDPHTEYMRLRRASTAQATAAARELSTTRLALVLVSVFAVFLFAKVMFAGAGGAPATTAVPAGSPQDAVMPQSTAGPAPPAAAVPPPAPVVAGPPVSVCQPPPSLLAWSQPAAPTQSMQPVDGAPAVTYAAWSPQSPQPVGVDPAWAADDNYAPSTQAGGNAQEPGESDPGPQANYPQTATAPSYPGALLPGAQALPPGSLQGRSPTWSQGPGLGLPGFGSRAVVPVTSGGSMQPD